MNATDLEDTLVKKLETIENGIAFADDIAIALKQHRPERAMLDAGVSQLLADDIMVRGWRDPRPVLRREKRTTEKRLAGLRRWMAANQ